MVSKEIISAVEQAIKNNKVFVASKTYCPYCQATLKTFEQTSVQPYVMQLNTMADGDAIQEYLKELTGQRTVPNIFINGKHIGGNSDLQQLKSLDALEEMLR